MSSPIAAFAIFLLHAAIAVSAWPADLRRRVQIEGDATKATPFVNGTISYVLEPFSGGDETIVFGGNATEADGGGWFSDGISNISLRRACQEETEAGDDVHSAGCVAVAYNMDEFTPSVGFGRTLQDDRYHSCLAATHLSLWLTHVVAGAESAILQARITLLTDDGDNFYFYDIYIPSAAGDNEWSELTFELPLGDPRLGRISGWRIELINGSGTVYLYRLACVGGSDMMGSAFTGQGDTPAELFEDLVSRDAFVTKFYESNVSGQDSRISITPFDPNGHASNIFQVHSIPGAILYDPYVVEQVKSWGGYTAVTFLAPGPAFYDLSEASAISFQYKTLQPASSYGRVHFRLILFDSSDCSDGMGCLQTDLVNMEAYYSFHHILDEEAGGVTKTITIDLEGSRDSSSPFWRTGWDGQVGNDVFDKSTIKGWALEINVDSQGELGSITTGSVMVGNFTANFAKEATSKSEHIRIIVEPDLLIDVASPALRKVEFIAKDRCPELCREDSECLYAQSLGGKNCYLSSRLGSDDILLRNTELLQKDVQVFWMDDIDKRGDFCDLCDCNEKVQSIDCSDRDLAIVPKSFGQDWKPLSLDLRGNPNIVIVGDGTFGAISDSLQELWLPLSLRHLSTASIKDLPMLSKVHIEGDGDNSNRPNNVIWEHSDSFQDICCGLGQQIELSASSETLTFCNMQVDKPGIDTVFEPFVEYYGASILMKLRPSSNFMSEAALSADYCAEYCSVTMGCNYFKYDARWRKAEHTCNLLIDNGTSTDNVCCDPDDFGDQEQTIPGWTSGRPPRTRNVVDNASVKSEPRELTANEENNFTVSYSVSLGSTPLRGAVWIEPALEGAQTDAVVTISPTRASLYDANMTATFEVVLSGSLRKETLMITNSIQSCDKAYTSGTLESISMNNIFIAVKPDKMNYNFLGSIRYVGYCLVALIVGSSIACAIWVQIYRDTTIVTASQPIFLYLLLFGTAILGSSIIPLTFDDDNPDNEGSDAACIAFPWLASTGLNVVFSALFSKIWRINKIYTASRMFRHIKVTYKDVLAPLIATLSINFILCLLWTLSDPPRWTRVIVIKDFESYGYCHIGEGVASRVLVVLLLVLNFLSVVMANIQAYRTRAVSDDFSESKYVALAMISIMQILMVGIPLGFLTFANPKAYFFVLTSMILVITMSVLLCLFAPKFLRIARKASVTARPQSDTVQVPANCSASNETSTESNPTSRFREIPQRTSFESNQNSTSRKNTTSSSLTFMS